MGATRPPAQPTARPTARPAERPAERSYGGRTRQERETTRRAALIDAALDVLAADGLAGVGVRSVCARAGLTTRYFYESFENTDALLGALSDDIGEQIVTAALIGVATEGTVEERLHTTIAGVYDVLLDDPRKGAVVSHGVANPAMNASRRRQLLRYADLVLTEILLVAPGDDEARLRALAFYLVGGSVALFTAVVEGDLVLTRDEMVERTVEMFLGAIAVQETLR